MIRRLLRRGVRSAALWALVGALALLGAVFLAIAAYLALLSVLAPPLAALVTAGGALLLAAVVAVLACGGSGSGREAQRARSQASRGAMETELALLLGKGVSEWISQHPRSATAGALATGLVSGMSPRARRTLIALLRDGASLLNDLAASADTDGPDGDDA